LRTGDVHHVEAKVDARHLGKGDVHIDAELLVAGGVHKELLTDVCG
jgi:hypothetical protein